jgi:tetratricopeptide (TPR) repeat protein
VFVLPGILGSHLTVDGKRVWLSLRFVNNLDRLEWDPATARQVKPDGPLGFSYDDLIDHLGATHEVVPFDFDWRRPIEDEAKRLAELVDTALKVRQATQQPVRLIAHSMGGLVARTMQLERPETWKRMMARDGARLLMLGTPNGGSFAPMQVLSGDDRFGNLLSAFGSLFDDHGARQLIAGMPGLLQLQAALIDGAHGLGKTAGWRALAEADLAALRRRRDERSWWHSDALQIRSFEWGVPPQSALDKAVALRRALDGQREALGADAAKILLVVGKAPLTPVDVRATDDGVEYLDVPEDGDGRVTFASASLPGVRAWQVDAVHGDLADHKPAFGAYVELLSRGTTSLLPAALPVAAPRGGAPEARALVRSRPARVPSDGHPPVAQRDVIAPLERRVERRGGRGSRLRVRFVHGNLKFVREPLMLGHYRSLKLSGTEAVIDTLLDGVMSEALRAGLYPSVIASSQIFRNTRRNPEDPFVLPRPEAAIVVGLGEEGLLRMSGLAETVRQGVLAYAKRVGERGGGGPTTFELAATLIGSGGYSVSVGTAAQAVVIGVGQANQRLAEVGWPQVAVLHLIEVFLDRATEGHNALRTLSEEAQDFVVEDAITRGRGGLPRPIDAGYRGADYDFISVQRRGEGDDAPIEFTLDTRRARDEVRGVPVQPQLVDELVQAGANAANNDRQIGRTLFQLLVPLEIEPFLSGSSSVLLQLDRRSARYPWELLDTPRNDRHGEGDARPWAVRTRLVRKLRTPDYRERPRDANSDADILIIGEPLCDAEKYPPLPGAAAEARVVAEALGVRPLLNEGARTIMNAVYDKAYKIVHVAGHGDVIDGIGGVVLSDGTLGPREIKAMRTVPELVFINCCHLGRFDVAPVEGLPAFAANVAEELIKIGVRCVVAAGWAVDDEPAMAFARCFYAKLLLGCPFVEAVGIARQETWADYRSSNTWAAYQCYGDPDWTYVPGGGDARALRRPPVTSAEALVLRLRSLVVAHSYDGRPTDDVRSEIDELARACAGRWGGEGAVATAFGAAFAEIEDFDRAVEWYERALRTEDGGGTLHATEQLGNVRARRGEKMSDLAAGRQEIDAGITLLLQVAEFGLTVERASLLGSAYKRMAMLEQRAKRRAAAEDALKAAAEWYGRAEDIARRGKADNLYYPAMNRMSIALMLDPGRAGPGGFGASEVAAVRASLEKKNADDPDFWSVIGLTELRIYEALGKRQLARAVEGIVGDLKDLKARAASRRRWGSVADQARLTLTPYAAATDLPPGEREAAARLLAEIGAGGEKETGKRAGPRKRREKSGRKRRK